jgi:hypothetical protein
MTSFDYQLAILRAVNAGFHGFAFALYKLYAKEYPARNPVARDALLNPFKKRSVPARDETLPEKL